MNHFFTALLLVFSFSHLFAENWNTTKAPSTSDPVVGPIDIDSILQEGFDNHRDNSDLLLQSGVIGLEASKKVDYTKGEARSLLNLMMYHTFYGEKDTALVLSNESIQLANQINAKSIIALNRHYRGLSYQQSGKYQEALAEYVQAIDINRELGDNAQLIKQTNNVALVYRELKDYESARNYLDETYELAVKVGNEEIQIISKVNQGYILIDQDRYEEAHIILLEAMPKVEETNKLGKAIYNRLMAQALTGLGRFDESIEFANKAIDFSKELNYSEGVFNAQFAIADTYFHDGKYQQAIRIAEEATKDPNVKYETRYVHQLYQILSTSYRQLGNLNKSIEYQDEYLRLNEQIFNEDQQRFATRLKIEYNLKESKRENELLKKQSVADKKQIKNQQYLYLTSFLMALLGLGLAFQFYKSSRKDKEYNQKLESAIATRTKELQESNRELQNSNYELERFAFIASHDLKEPLKTVISFSELIQQEVKHKNIGGRLSDYAEFVEKGSKRLFALVHSIFEFSRIDKNLLNNAEILDMNELVSSLVFDYKSKAAITSDDLPNIYGNHALIYTVLQNLIQNGIKYNANEKPSIHLGHVKDEEKHIISITDDGLGFDIQFKDNVFDMFTRLNTKDEYEGAGLGLAICKKVMNAHKGEIWVDSKVGEGSTFYLSFNRS